MAEKALGVTRKHRRTLLESWQKAEREFAEPKRVQVYDIGFKRFEVRGRKRIGTRDEATLSIIRIVVGISISNGRGFAAWQENDIDPRVMEARPMFAVCLGALGKHADLRTESFCCYGAMDHAAAIKSLDLTANDVFVYADMANKRDFHALSTFDLPKAANTHSEAANSVDKTSAPIHTMKTSLNEYTGAPPTMVLEASMRYPLTVS